jgi:hypothetical protein
VPQQRLLHLGALKAVAAVHVQHAARRLEQGVEQQGDLDRP